MNSSHTSDMFKIIPVPAFQDNYIWIMANPSNQQALIVDPGDAKPVIEFFKNQPYQPCAILITHHHWDHTHGINDLLKKYTIPVYGPAKEPIPQRQYPLKEGQHITIPGIEADFDIIDIPGHTAGHIAYYGHGVLFCGDTLFLGGCGRLFEGTAEQMYESLSKLASLPEETLIYCAHEYTLANLKFALAVEPDNAMITQRMQDCKQQREQQLPTIPATLSQEKQTNPFLRTHQLTILQAAEKITGQTLKNPVQILSTIRQWKDSF